MILQSCDSWPISTSKYIPSDCPISTPKYIPSMPAPFPDKFPAPSITTQPDLRPFLSGTPFAGKKCRAISAFSSPHWFLNCILEPVILIDPYHLGLVLQSLLHHNWA